MVINMHIILGIISYFLIGFIAGFVICKIKGKEWCRANSDFDREWFDNNAQGAMLMLTFFWGVLVGGTILFSPFLIMYYSITYIAKKLQE